MVLHTSRLLLRPFRESDAGELYALARDPLIGPSAGWPPHTSVENSRQIIRNVLSLPHTFAVVDGQSGHLLGSIGLKKANVGFEVKEDQLELGYWIGVAHWGKGLIPEAVQAVLTYGFENLQLSAVWCGYYDGNERSKRVQEKCGFVPHHSVEMEVSLLGERRLCHFSKITKGNDF